MLRPCFVCGSTESKMVYHNQLAPIGECDMSYTLARCTNCNNFYANNIPSIQTYANYYKSYSKYDYFENIEQIPSNNFSRGELILQYLKQHLGNIPESCLDLGCGAGVFLHQLKQKGATRVVGFDFAPKSKECAQKFFDIDKIYIGSLLDLICSHNIADFQLISCMAILEHLPNLREFLQCLFDKMSLGQHLLVNVPYCFDQKQMDWEILGELSIEHINFFNESNLYNLMKSIGFECIDVQKVDFGEHVDVFGLFRKSNTFFSNFDKPNGQSLSAELYIEDGVHKLLQCTKKLDTLLEDKAFNIYGAGSHTARVLPALQKINLNPCFIFDSNENLHGKTLGGIEILPKPKICNYASMPILISSFRYETFLYEHLKQIGMQKILGIYSQEANQ